VFTQTGTTTSKRVLKRVFSEVYLNNLKTKKIAALKKLKFELTQKINKKINKNRTKLVKAKKIWLAKLKKILIVLPF